MSRACCLQRSSFPSAAGFFLLIQANRAGPWGSCIQFWAIDIVEKADKAIAAATDFIALIFICPSPLRLGRREPCHNGCPARHLKSRQQWKTGDRFAPVPLSLSTPI